MSSALGLFELLLVLLVAFGWGAYELWSVRGKRGAKTRRAKRDEPEA